MKHNQLSIKIEKSYPWLDYDDTIAAVRTLNYAAFKLYIYFCSFEKGEVIDFSPSRYAEEFNTNLSSQKNGMYELIAKGFLVKQTETYYIFYPTEKN